MTHRYAREDRLRRRRSARFFGVEIRGLRAPAVVGGMAGTGSIGNARSVCAVMLWRVSTDSRGRRRVSARRFINSIARKGIVSEHYAGQPSEQNQGWQANVDRHFHETRSPSINVGTQVRLESGSSQCGPKSAKPGQTAQVEQSAISAVRGALPGSCPTKTVTDIYFGSQPCPCWRGSVSSQRYAMNSRNPFCYKGFRATG